MMKNEILKPCPFCGSEVEIARLDMDQGGVTSIEIRCRCGAEIRFVSDDYIFDWTDTPHQMGLTAIEKFNNRVTDGDAISRCELTRDPHYAAPTDKAVIIDRCGYCMGASFNDCEECHRRRAK